MPPRPASDPLSLLVLLVLAGVVVLRIDPADVAGLWWLAAVAALGFTVAELPNRTTTLPSVLAGAIVSAAAPVAAWYRVPGVVPDSAAAACALAVGAHTIGRLIAPHRWWASATAGAALATALALRG